jgi:hypothetical protein
VTTKRFRCSKDFGMRLVVGAYEEFTAIGQDLYYMALIGAIRWYCA